MIQIQKVNSAFIKITGDYDDKQIISNHFTVNAPNFYFSPKYKAGIWDGRIRYMNWSTGYLPYGLFSELISCAGQNDINVDVEEKLIKDVDDMNINDFDKHAFMNMNPDFLPGGSKEVRDYQLEGAKLSLQAKRGLLEHATRSGKSLTSFLAVNYIYNKFLKGKVTEYKIVVVVPTTQLILQFTGDYIEYGFPEDKIGKYFADEKNNEATLIVGTWQSLRSAQHIHNNVLFLICDEVHGGKSTEIKTLTEKCTKATIRIGMTGTLPEEECDRLTITGCFGPIISTIKARELIDRGILAEAHINSLLIHYPKKIIKKAIEEIVKKQKKKTNAKYRAEKIILRKHPKRHKLACKLAKKHPDDTMLYLFDEEKMGLTYYEKLKKEFPDRKVLFVNGGIKTTEREKIRQTAINEKGVIVVASIKTFATGITIPNLHVITFLWVGKSTITIIQAIGRGLGKCGTKEKVIIYDFNDQLHYTGKHGNERLRIYMHEGHTTKLFNIHF